MRIRWSRVALVALAVVACDFGEVEAPSGRELGEPAPGPIEGEDLEQGDRAGPGPQWDVREPEPPSVDREEWVAGLEGVAEAGMKRVPALEEDELDHGLAGWFEVSGERSPERQRFESYARPTEPVEGYGAWALEGAQKPASAKQLRELWNERFEGEAAEEPGVGVE